MSDYETIQRRRNIIVGIFVIVAISALVWLIFKFGDLPATVTKISSFNVFVQFPTAPGVQKDTPVQFCGYQIGRVTKVMAPEIRRDKTGLEYHQIMVVLSIDKKYRNIPSNVEIRLMTRGLGSSFIELTVDPSKLPAPPLDPNRPETQFLGEGFPPLQGSTGMTSEFFPAESQKKLDQLITHLVALLDNANDIIGDPNNKENLKQTLANLTEASKHATVTLQQAQQTIKLAEGMIEEFRKVAATGTKTFQNADAKVEKLVTAVIGTSEQLTKTISQLRLMLEKVNSGQGSVAKLINDGRLYESLLDTTLQLQVLLAELKSLVDEVKEKGLRSIY